jgi:Cdc6-like AAA superfamily ATPase
LALFSSLRSLRKRKAPPNKSTASVVPRTSPPVASDRGPLEREARPRLPRFHTTATDHLDRDKSARFGRERIRVRNAFTPAQPVVDGRMFAGRADLLGRMIQFVEDQRMHVVIFGERGVGKTSLIHMLSIAAREARYIVIYVSCGATSDFSETFRTVATEIPLLYHNAVSPSSTTSHAGSTLADMFGSAKVTPRLFADNASKLVGTRVIVVLDEFDRAESPEFRRDIAELIKTLSDMSARVQLVIAGVAADLVDLMEHVASIRRSVAGLHVPAMTEPEVREIIANGERTSGLVFEGPASDHVVAAACGSPYLTTLVCHLAGLIALDNGRMKVNLEDVANAVEAAMEDLRRRLPTEIMVRLDAIADAVLSLPPKAPRRGVNGPGGENPSQDVEIMTALENSGFLEKAGASRFALVADSLVPYLHLKQARDRYTRDASRKPVENA